MRNIEKLKGASPGELAAGLVAHGFCSNPEKQLDTDCLLWKAMDAAADEDRDLSSEAADAACLVCVSAWLDAPQRNLRPC